jgi:hypothetical protein
MRTASDILIGWSFVTSLPSVAAGLWRGILNLTSLVDRLDLLFVKYCTLWLHEECGLWFGFLKFKLQQAHIHMIANDRD